MLKEKRIFLLSSCVTPRWFSRHQPVLVFAEGRHRNHFLENKIHANTDYRPKFIFTKFFFSFQSKLCFMLSRTLYLYCPFVL